MDKNRGRYDKVKKYKNICKICNLDYPKYEIKDKICYLCKIEMKKAN